MGQFHLKNSEYFLATISRCENKGEGGGVGFQFSPLQKREKDVISSRKHPWHSLLLLLWIFSQEIQQLVRNKTNRVKQRIKKWKWWNYHFCNMYFRSRQQKFKNQTFLYNFNHRTLCQKSYFCSKTEIWRNLTNHLIWIFAPKFSNVLEF